MSHLPTAARRAITRRKPLSDILSEDRTSRQSRSSRNSQSKPQLLSLFDLLCIGVGGTIGSGVFVLTGSVYPKAGPSACLAWLFSALVCCCSATSYCELSSKIPTKGSCYIFAYATLGEFFAIVGAVCLTLEYAVAGAGIATSWSAKVATLFNTTTVLKLGGVKFDVAAALLEATCVCVCLCKLDLGKNIINLFTVMKVCLVSVLIVSGILLAVCYGRGGGDATYNTSIFLSYDEFFPKGIGGCISATSLLFFGFIGFDEVCCMAGKAENPRSVMPRAILGTLLIAAVVSTLAQLSLTLLIPWSPTMESTSFEDAFESHGFLFLKWLVAIGEVVLLPLVCLVSFLPEPELLAAMSEDKLLPSFLSFQNENEVFVNAGKVAGVALVFVSLLVPFAILWDVISLGVLLSFNLTNTSLIMLRCGNGGEMVSNKSVRLFCMLLWIFAMCGSYMVYHGISPVLYFDKDNQVVNLDDDNKSVVEGGSVNWNLTGGGLGCIWLAFICMYMIKRNEFGGGDESDENKTTEYRTPCVPFVPGTAIILNFFLSASFPLNDHLLLVGIVGVALIIYMFYKLTKRIGIEGKIRKSHFVTGTEKLIGEEEKKWGTSEWDKYRGGTPVR